MIDLTFNSQIDQASHSIACAVSKANPGWSDASCWHEAVRLRDAIMAGTRELDAPEPPLDNWMVGDRERILADADEAVARFQGRQDDSFMGPAL